MSKKRFRPQICLILQQSCCLYSKSCCWIIRSCRYFSKVVSELSVFLTSWILARGDPFLKAHFQFGAEPQITSGWQSTSQEGQRVGWEYPQVERNRETPRGGGGWFREDTVIICSDGFSWQFSRPLINHGKHDRERVNVVKNTRPQFQKIEGECYLTTSVAQPCGWQAFFLPYSWLCG